MAKFPPFSLIFPILGHFTGSWISCVVGYFLGLRFKAKKVTFRELFRVFRKRELFGSKTWFLPKFSFWGENPPILAPKPVFPPLGLQKPPQNVVFNNHFERGAPGSHFEPQSAVLGPGNRKRASFRPKTHFWGPGPPRGACHFKNLKYFLGNTNDSDMSEIMKFLEISWFSWNFHFFMKSAQKVSHFFWKIMFFAPARPAAANVV